MLFYSFPNINPIAFSLGPINIYWYALAYVFGTIFAGYYAKKLANKFSLLITSEQIDNILTYGIIGMIVGGRLGYVLFYEPERFYKQPLEIFKTYNGGMSFHGGLIGITIAASYFCYSHKASFLRSIDLFCAGIPVGIFLGRIANFINGELYGRVTDTAFGIIFPYTDGRPRHPSQLYEALLEGIFLFLLINFSIFKNSALNKTGRVTGLFLLYYGLFRIIIENFREPDAQLGFILGNYLTMGQILTLPMVLVGSYLIYNSSSNIKLSTSSQLFQDN